MNEIFDSESQSLNSFKARIDKHMSNDYFKNQQY
jgi:hypothetical protein